MLILSYFISLVIFFISELIFPGLVLSIYGLIAVSFVKEKDFMFSYSTQFIGSFIGTFIGVVIAMYSFNWFNTTPKYYFAVPMYGIFSLWLKPNAAIKTEMQPKAQRLGVILAILAILTYYFIKPI